jgi:spermidine synthase
VDGTVQSVLADDPFGYWHALVPSVKPRRGLLLGLGAGTVVRLIHDRFGSVPLVGVDDDEAVLTVARDALRDLSSVEIVQEDAFKYVERMAAAGEHFDYAAVDLYRGASLAHGIVGRPFLKALKTLLEPRGVACFNLFLERRVADRVRRIERVFPVLDRRMVGKNIIIWVRA